MYFASSNPKVLKNGNDGYFYVVGPGNVAISAIAADNSGVKGSVSMTVIQNAVSVEIPSDGYDTVALGKALTLSKPVISPANSNVKTVAWSVDPSSAANGIKVAGGKLTSSRTTFAPTVCTVYAKVTNKDGTTAIGSRDVCIYNMPVTGITMDKTATIFRKNNNFETASSAEISVKVSGGVPSDVGKVDPDSFTISMSNQNMLAPIDREHNITVVSNDTFRIKVYSLGEGCGKVNLTVAARDGSGKKAVCAINVINPVSSVRIAPAKAGEYACVTAGKKLALKAVVGTEYGKPVNTKVIWSIPEADKAYASISNTGVLTVKADTPNKKQITVTATAADGSGAFGKRTVTVYKMIEKKMEATLADDSKAAKLVYEQSGYSCPVYLRVYCNSTGSDYYPFGGFKLATSNGKVAQIRFITIKARTSSYVDYEFEVMSIGKGNAKLSISTYDGSQTVAVNATVKKTVPIRLVAS